MELESGGGQKFLPPNPLPFCPPERLDFKIRNSDFRQKMFELRPENTAKNHISKNQGWLPRQHLSISLNVKLGGGGRIRTCEELLALNTLAPCRFRPLSHASVFIFSTERPKKMTSRVCPGDFCRPLNAGFPAFSPRLQL